MADQDAAKARPWYGLAPEEDIRALEERGQPMDRATRVGNSPCLLVVDMTRSFVDPRYAANCAQTGGEQATLANERILEAARAARLPIFFTQALRNSRDGSFLPIELGKGLQHKAHLLATPDDLPDGNEVSERLAPRPGEIVIGKPKPSAFHGTALDTYLNLLDVDSIIVTGMVTSGCVRATVIDAYMRNHHVVVPQDAVADYSLFQHRTSLLDMHAKYADVAYPDEVIDHLEALATLPQTSAP